MSTGALAGKYRERARPSNCKVHIAAQGSKKCGVGWSTGALANIVKGTRCRAQPKGQLQNTTNSRLSPASGGAVDNARLLARANYGHCAVHKSKLLMY